MPFGEATTTHLATLQWNLIQWEGMGGNEECLKGGREGRGKGEREEGRERQVLGRRYTKKGEREREEGEERQVLGRRDTKLGGKKCFTYIHQKSCIHLSPLS